MTKKLLKLVKDKKYIKFYQSKEWRHKRKDIFDRDNNECQHCKEQGKFSHGECVHHIKHLKDYPMLGLDNNNLITLCNACHNKQHPEKFADVKANRKKPEFENKERW